MVQQHHQYQLDDALARINFDVVHAWLAASYWSPGIARQRVEQGARHSAVVIGAYHDHAQVGYARIVSDTTRFAYLCDVFVDPAHRGQGLAKAVVQFALDHPDLAGVEKWFLRTQDAHAVYQPLGFQPITDPQYWMSYTPPVSAKR